MYHQGTQKKILRRPLVQTKLPIDGLHPLLERIFLGRGVTSPDDLDRSLARLPSPWLLAGIEKMVAHLITALEQNQKIVIVADFDADGATSCAVAIKGLQLFGAKRVSFVVPNRFEYGYGLTPEIVELVKQEKPDEIITVDNGIASIDGVRAAKQAGIKVLVTDHHLPGPELPQYQFTPAVDGGACLDAPGLQAYDQEPRLLGERLEYLRDLLREAGAVEGCGDGAR